MPNANELLHDPRIAAWLDTHQGAAEAVRTAGQLLADKPDGLKALEKLLPALGDKVVRVFFSYKSSDARAAKEVVQMLRTYSAKLQISYMGEFTKEIAGQNWRARIMREVRRANWFILLLPDPSEDWDWCLYETGLFDRQANSGDRVICLHHPDIDIPDPIADYHHVPATEAAVEEFLRMVYLEDNPIPGLPALNPAASAEIPGLAKKIVHAIRPPRKVCREVFEPTVVLRVPNASTLADRDDLDEAEVLSANREALKLFGYLVQPRTWGKLRGDIREARSDSRWREEMFHVIRRIAQDRTFQPIQATFQAANEKLYRPVVHAVEREGSHGPICSFHLTFTEDVAAIDSSAIPHELSDLAILLRFTFRFRWEVLEQFAIRTMKAADIKRLDTAFRRMNKDWDSRGVGGELQIIDLFPKDQQPRVLDMLQTWDEVKNNRGTGTLDVAMRNEDPEACSTILAEFLPMNQEFLAMTAERFTRLVADHAPATRPDASASPDSPASTVPGSSRAVAAG